VRDNALLITRQHDGIYLEPGKNEYFQEAARRKESTEVIQRCVRELIRQRQQALNHE
jgi:hypothetical protein